MTIEKAQNIILLIVAVLAVVFTIFAIPHVVVFLLEMIRHYTGFSKLITAFSFLGGLMGIGLIAVGVLELFKKEDTLGNENTDE